MGACFGVTAGALITWTQKTYGIIKIQMTSSILDAYPVSLLGPDIIIITFMVITVAALASLFPAILNAKKNDFNLYISRLQNLYTMLVLISLLITFPLIYFSEIIILTLFGDDYKSVTNVLYLHLLAGIFVSLGVARRNWIISENLQIFSLCYQTAGMVLNIFLNLYLIPLYGIEGAAAATLMSQFLVVILFPSIFKKTRLASIMAIKALTLINIKNLLKNH